jgi:tetratricopeptide (TPR) repeat protein
MDLEPGKLCLAKEVTMLRKTLVLCLTLVVLGTLSCARQEPQAPDEEAFKKLREASGELEAAEDKLKLAEEFLETYPDSEHAPSVLSAAIYYRSEPMSDPAGAKALAEKMLPGITDPEDRFDIGLSLHRLALKLEQPSPLRQVAEELAQAKNLSYVNHLDVLEAAVKIPDWELVLEHAEAAIAFADAETFRADYPDQEFEDEVVERATTRRRGNCLAYKAGALLNLDRLDEALPLFTEAEEFTTFDYVGIPETPLYRFWGEAELIQANPTRAAELLAPEAVMGKNEEALDGLRRAYNEIKGSDEGFDDYLWETRQKLARAVDDFSLPTYDGEMVSLSGLNGKVVMLNFWNPG